MYRYASRCIYCNIRRRLSNIAKSRRIDATRLAYRYIRKLIGRKKGRGEIMQNGREGGERQIYVKRQRRMKCQKFWWKWGSHKNRDISEILQYFAKPFWICIDGWMGYMSYWLVFLRPNIRPKAMETEGETFGFRDISRFSIVNISWTKWDKNPDFIPLESPCDSEQNRPSPDF